MNPIAHYKNIMHRQKTKTVHICVTGDEDKDQ